MKPPSFVAINQLATEEQPRVNALGFMCAAGTRTKVWKNAIRPEEIRYSGGATGHRHRRRCVPLLEEISDLSAKDDQKTTGNALANRASLPLLNAEKRWLFTQLARELG